MKPTVVLCLPRAVCNQALGHNHKIGHRMVAGAIIMAIGVAVAKSAGMFESEYMHFSLYMVGYGIHGLGCTPFIEALIAEA